MPICWPPCRARHSDALQYFDPARLRIYFHGEHKVSIIHHRVFRLSFQKVHDPSRLAWIVPFTCRGKVYSRKLVFALSTSMPGFFSQFQCFGFTDHDLTRFRSPFGTSAEPLLIRSQSTAPPDLFEIVGRFHSLADESVGGDGEPCIHLATESLDNMDSPHVTNPRQEIDMA